MFQGVQTIRKVDWKCSNGWIDNFLKRNRLSTRIPTSQKSSNITKDEQNKRIRSFWRHGIRLRTQFAIETHQIFNMDEVPVNFDMMRTRTLNVRGHVLVKSTGAQKKRCTVVLCVCADGTKLPPTIIFKGTKQNHKSIRSIEKRRDTQVLVQKKAWMDSTLMLTWAKKFSTSRIVQGLTLRGYSNDPKFIGCGYQEVPLHSSTTIRR